MQNTNRSGQVLLFVIATVLVFWALKATQPVSLPLAFGVVLLLFFRPLQKTLDRHLPRWVGIALVTLIVLAFLAFLGGLLYYSASRVGTELPQYADEVGSRLQAIEGRLQEQGISVQLPGGEEGGWGSALPSNLAGDAASAAQRFLSTLGLVTLTLTVMIFLLIEVDGFRRKLGSGATGASGPRFLEAFDRMAGRFERYFLVQAFTSVITGLLTWGWCAILGVEFAFVWGVVAFVFNFVPTVGSILAVVPPTLFAFLFGGFVTGLAVFAGLTLIQLLLGNFVDPALQGRAVELAPVVVLLAVVFWGWLWGIGGAIIGVPMTIALVLVFEEFERTRPVARFLKQPQQDG